MAPPVPDMQSETYLPKGLAAAGVGGHHQVPAWFHPKRNMEKSPGPLSHPKCIRLCSLQRGRGAEGLG